MYTSKFRKLEKALINLPNLLYGYNIYVNKNKFKLIDRAFNNLSSEPKTFADMGGVWKVNAAYTFYTLKKHNIKQGFLIDTNSNEVTDKKSKQYPNLKCINANFTDKETVEKIGKVDVIFFFDVLLHQVKPDWNEVLKDYSKITDCIAIYNQQYINSEDTIRLTALPLEEYKNIAPKRDDDVYDYIYSHKNDLNTEYNKNWGDIHNIWQWGITDNNLRETLAELNFSEVFYKNYGQFSQLKHFEDHGFVFIKNHLVD